MKQDQTFRRAIGFLTGLFVAGGALAQTSSIEQQMDLVVKLRIYRTAQSTEETAAGIFVGKDRQSAYFITACTQNRVMLSMM